jgi:dolichol-phosphate mannosyltransferase
MSDMGTSRSSVPDTLGAAAPAEQGPSTPVSVVVPTYNEAQNLPELVKRIVAALPRAEVIVIDDASPDGTADVGRELGKTLPVRVVERKDEKGLSTAVLRGLQEARTDLCVVMDADLSHPPERIPLMVQAVLAGADVAVGSRYVKGGDIDEWPLFRRFASKAGTILARPLTAVHDPMAGFFCLRRSLLDGVTLKPRGFKILLEILARTGTKKTAEVPIRFEDRAKGESKFGPKQRREYLRQIWDLYTDLNAWPLRIFKFLVTGAIGLLIDNAVLLLVLRAFGESDPTRMAGSFAGFLVAMTFNYSLNRIWTFRARNAPLVSSYAKYACGTLGGLAVKMLAMKYLSPPMHPLLSNTLGIIGGTVVNYLASQLWAFSRR